MNAANSRAAGLVWIAVSATGFGSMAIFAKIAYRDGVDLPTLLFLRFAIAGAMLAGVMLWTRRRWPRGRDALVLVLMGGVGYVGQSYCYFASLQQASAGVTALLLYLYPALVALIGAALLGRPLGRARAVAVAMALAGSAMTVAGALHSTPLGIVLGALAALIYAIYILVGERTTPRVGSLPSASVVILAAAAVYGGVWLAGGSSLPATGAAWSAVLAIAVFSTVVAILGFFVGMRHLGAADASTASTLEPLMTIMLAALFLGEVLSPLQILGGGVILAAVVLIVRLPVRAVG